MPVLSPGGSLRVARAEQPAGGPAAGGGSAARAGILQSCANPRCGSGWLHLWRGRSAPVFEGGWICSPACTEEQMRVAVRRELEGRGMGAVAYHHRLPLGLLMMEQGWITPEQLKRALEEQRAAGGGRLGQFLVRQGAVSEQLVTRALSLQWSCPVLPLQFHDAEALAPVLPRLFIDAFGVMPLRIAAEKIVYLGFEERLNAVLALALERMSGLRVESGMVQGTQFRPAHERMLRALYPPAQLLEAVSEPALVRALARAVERARPVASRLVRVHDCLWLRMWKKAQAGPVPDAASVEDVIGSVGE
jgi:Type II secretion system (T2SS), protein E, N-terminal domain